MERQRMGRVVKTNEQRQPIPRIQCTDITLCPRSTAAVSDGVNVIQNLSFFLPAGFRLGETTPVEVEPAECSPRNSRASFRRRRGRQPAPPGARNRRAQRTRRGHQPVAASTARPVLHPYRDGPAIATSTSSNRPGGRRPGGRAGPPLGLRGF